MRFYPQILELLGAALIVVGLALWAVPTALVVAGLFLVLAANTATGAARAAPVSQTRTDRRRRAA